MEEKELQDTVDEGEYTIEQEEDKVHRALMEINEIRQKAGGRIDRKEKEFEGRHVSPARALDSRKISIKLELEAKFEAPRVKKKLEGDIDAPENPLDYVKVMDERTQSVN